MITLYGSMHSRANRCAWMLKELKIDYQSKPVDFQDGSTHRPEFLAINPNGRVPVLDDSGFVIFESLAINLYLAKRYGGPLAPSDLKEDALITQWSLWVENEIEKTLILAAANQSLFAPPSARSTDELHIALEKLKRPWDVLEKHLQTQPYLIGERFTVADLNVASVMVLALIAEIDLSAWPVMQRWLSECLGRPAATGWQDISFSIPRPQTALGVLQMFV
jgi:glutathione S-transferase